MHVSAAAGIELVINAFWESGKASTGIYEEKFL